MLCFLILGAAFVFLGRGFLASERRENMEATAQEVARTAVAYGMLDSYFSESSQEGWRSMEMRIILSSTARTSGYHIFLADENGLIVSCSDRPGTCTHIGSQISEQVMYALSTGTEKDLL